MRRKVKNMAKRPDAIVNKIQFDSSEVDTALRKQIPEKPIFLHNRSDTCSLWECPQCKRRFATTHKPGVLDGTDIYYCPKCGKAFDWRDE